jgi:site-specific DNA-cytosine methylase
MKILVACEESQSVTKEFRKLGHEAYSCDIIKCSGGHPEWHIQQDVTELLKEKWDMIIAFPPCTYLTVTGNRWFNVEKYGEKAIKDTRIEKKLSTFLCSLLMLIAKK